MVVVVLKEWDDERRFLLVSKFGSIDSSDSFPCAFAATQLLLHVTVLGGLEDGDFRNVLSLLSFERMLRSRRNFF